MPDVILTAKPRQASGSRPAGRLRRSGLVPAVVYGLGNETVTETVGARELQHILTSGSGVNTVITLQIEGDGGDQLALARQIQRHPVKGTLVHVDFVRIRADQTVTAEVPLHIEGEAEGVKNGGLLEQNLFAIPVEALPADHASTTRRLVCGSKTRCCSTPDSRANSGTTSNSSAGRRGRSLVSTSPVSRISRSPGRNTRMSPGPSATSSRTASTTASVWSRTTGSPSSSLVV